MRHFQLCESSHILEFILLYLHFLIHDLFLYDHSLINYHDPDSYPNHVISYSKDLIKTLDSTTSTILFHRNLERYLV